MCVFAWYLCTPPQTDGVGTDGVSKYKEDEGCWNRLMPRWRVRQRQEMEVTAGGVYPRAGTTRPHTHKLALENHGNLCILRFRVMIFPA